MEEQKPKKLTPKEEGEKHAGGRPTKYKPEYAKQAYKLSLLGTTDQNLADFFEVALSTISEWKNTFPEFSDALKKGKQVADATVANSLYKRANGYKVKVDKIFQYEGSPVVVPTTEKYPPDTTAAIFWLKNRQPDQWRDKKELTGDINHKHIVDIPDEE